MAPTASNSFYSKGYRTYKKDATGGEQVLGYARFTLEYPACEYRNAWRFQGQPVVERLHDKHHRWSSLRNLIPDMIAGGLLGHQFMCPDMIGGGDWNSFRPGAKIDPELFVRFAQVHALCPMMQFSASPWRVLDKKHQQCVRDAVALRQKFAPEILRLAEECGRTGEPMLRNMEYCFPGMGYASIKEQFMLGDTLLVAPQLRGGAKEREVVIPPGTWRSDDGSTVKGPAVVTVSTPLSRLPHFMKVD